MVADLALALEIRVVPTVRDADGLALSSRNQLLAPEERQAATAIPQALAAGAEALPRRPRRRGRGQQGPRSGAAGQAPVRPGRPLRRAPRPRRRRARRRRPPDRQRRPRRRPGMTTRPRQPGPNAPAPGKLPLTELAEMKRRGEKIVMVTAYDAPGGELADAAGVDLILVGDSAAMVVLGHQSTVPATVDELIVLTRAVTRGAKRPLVIADMPFGSFQVSDERGGRERRPLPQGGGRRGGQARGRRPDALARARARRERDPRDGPHRPDAAVGDDARRLPRAGPHRREGDAPVRGRARARAGRLLRARARGGAGAGRDADHARRSRSRRSGSAPAPAATARCSSTTTCSASTRAARRGS